MRDFPVLELRDELSWLDGTLLAAMRAWVLGCKRGVPADLPIQMIFANLRTPEAIGHLDRFMRALSQGCTRMIEIYCTCEPVLSSDEVLLLDAFAMMQEGMHDAATALLWTLILVANSPRCQPLTCGSVTKASLSGPTWVDQAKFGPERSSNIEFATSVNVGSAPSPSSPYLPCRHHLAGSRPPSSLASQQPWLRS